MTAAIDVDLLDDIPQIGAVDRPIELNQTEPVEDLPSNEVDPLNAETVARGWRQIIMIVSTIASAVFLSAVGVLPSSILVAATVGVISTTVTLAAVIVSSAMSGVETEEKPDESGYHKRIMEMDPIKIAVQGPIIEEIIFRGILQGGLQWTLKKLLPATAISLLGLQLPVASVIAAVVAGAAFGYAHLANGHENSGYQAIHAGISGILVEGTMFAVYGLWASCLVHIINNTIISVIVQMEKSRALAETVSARTEPQYKDILAAAV